MILSYLLIVLTKLFSVRILRLYRVAPVWNGLRYDGFAVNSLKYFKRHLYNIDFSHLLKGTL